MSVTNSGFSDQTGSEQLCNEINQWNSLDSMFEVYNAWSTMVFPGLFWSLTRFWLVLLWWSLCVLNLRIKIISPSLPS